MSRYSVGVIKNPRSIDLYLAAKTKWTAIKQSILPYTVEPLLVWLDAVDPAHDQEDHQQQSLQQLLGDDSPCEDLDPQRWCHRHHCHPNRDYLAAGTAGFASAFGASFLAGVLFAGFFASFLTSALAGAAAGVAGALAGSAAKAVAANRPAIKVAIVFILNFLLG
jgi:hypothetical protein